jgi:F0F1-type ATP synthase assembly protein I
MEKFLVVGFIAGIVQVIRAIKKSALALKIIVKEGNVVSINAV